MTSQIIERKFRLHKAGEHIGTCSKSQKKFQNLKSAQRSFYLSVKILVTSTRCTSHETDQETHSGTRG